MGQLRLSSHEVVELKQDKLTPCLHSETQMATRILDLGVITHYRLCCVV